MSSDLNFDNATNFQGAKNKIDEIFSFLQSTDHNEVVSQFLTNESVKWHLVSPRSPHLTFEALSIYLIEIEAILNSRPLTPLSSDPNNETALTPALFIGDSLISLPKRTLEGILANRLSSW